MLRNLVVLSQDAEEDKLEDTGLWNMISLEQLTEDIMVKVIQERFTNNMIYTYSGSVLVSVNPYKLLPYYSADIMRSYRKQRPEELPPHLFAMAESAYRSMMTESKNQSIIISGESGSGKTEAAKVIIQYLAFINSKHTRVEQQILEANPLLEAFGNAKTISNDNSSRFGKLVQIYFDKDGRISGARIERYLLEKSRIVYQNPGERNYHIFYQLLSGATLEERASLHLKTPEDYFYLNRNACYEVNEMNDQEEFDIVKKALTIIGISHQSSDIFRVLAAILHLGNISFAVNEHGKAEISDPDAVLACQYVAELLYVSEEYITKLLLERKMTAGHDHYTIPLTADEAVDNRDALAKAMYDRLFRWLVGVINKSIHPPADQMDKYISILDIFGFESVENNSFEQFCINYANERLQQEFITYVFKLEQEEYQRDGLKWTYIDFKDNKECVDLIEKKPIGMLYLLDDESRLPDGTDQSWVEKVARSHSKGSAFSSVKTDSSSFIINHFVGKVQYNCKNFLEKSRDAFRAQFQEIGKESKDPFIGELLTLVTRERGTSFGKRPTQATLGLKFKEQVDSLMELVHGSACHYLRCIRPNDAKVANRFNQNMVMRQLQYSGMQSTIELRRAGYPVRLPFSAFMSRYKPILPRHAIIQSGSERESCLKFMSYLPMYEGEYQLGKTMIFLRYRMNASLEKILHLLRQNASKLIGRAFRDYKVQSERRQNRAASKIQNVFRRKSLLASISPLRTGQPLSANMAIQEEEETENSIASSTQSPVPPSTGIQEASSEITIDTETGTPLSHLSSVLKLEERAESPSMGVSESQTEKTEPSSPTQEKPSIPLQAEKPIMRPNIPRNAPPSASSASPMLHRRSIMPNALPKVVARMFEYLRLKGIEQVGIFRVAGAAAEIQAIMKNIEEGKDVVFHSVSDCNVVATVLKQYIRNMKEPIATYKLYDEFIDASVLTTKDGILEAIKKTVNKLPPFNRMFLQELCLFLSQVAEHSAINKMVPSNLAIVFAPNIFRSSADMSDADFIRSQHTCVVMAAMIESYHAIF